MPIYDYVCRKCNHKFETYHTMMDNEPEECTQCDGLADRVEHFHNQKLKRPDYIPPPKASRKFGEERPSPHVRKRWQ